MPNSFITRMGNVTSCHRVTFVESERGPAGRRRAVTFQFANNQIALMPLHC